MAILDEFLVCLDCLTSSISLKSLILSGVIVWVVLLVLLFILVYYPKGTLRQLLRTTREMIYGMTFGKINISSRMRTYCEKRTTLCNWLLRKDFEIRMALRRHLKNKWEYLRILYHILVWLFLLAWFSYTVMAFVTEECSLFYAFWGWVGYFIFALIMVELHNPRLHELFWDICYTADFLFYLYRRGIKDGLILFFENLDYLWTNLCQRISSYFTTMCRALYSCCCTTYGYVTSLCSRSLRWLFRHTCSSNARFGMLYNICQYIIRSCITIYARIRRTYNLASQFYNTLTIHFGRYTLYSLRVADTIRRGLSKIVEVCSMLISAVIGTNGFTGIRNVDTCLLIIFITLLLVLTIYIVMCCIYITTPTSLVDIATVGNVDWILLNIPDESRLLGVLAWI